MQINHLDTEDFYDLPCHVYWKDTKGIYQGSNDYPAKIMGINKQIDFIGYNDNELLQESAAAIIQQNDSWVIKNNTTLSTRRGKVGEGITIRLQCHQL